MQTVKTILHATDFSDLAANALHAALAIAQTYGARLILLYVKEPQEVIEGEFGMSFPQPEESDADIIDELGELLPKNTPVQVERLVSHGMAAETIVQVAKDKHCDLIVLGTHGRRRWLVCSLAAWRTVSYARRPVRS